MADLQAAAYKNRYLILALIMLGSFMAMLDGTMMSVALPTITYHFNVGLAESQWAITGYLLAMASLFIFFGKVSEYTGKTKLFLAGWALFTVSSMACGLASSLELLIVFRIVQGIGASMVSGLGLAMIYQIFPPDERGKAMGLIGIVIGGGALVGPGLGGFIVDHFGWKYIFLINVPIGVVLLALALKYMKIPEITSKKFEMDWIGAGSLFVAIVSLMMICTEIAKSITLSSGLIAYTAAFLVAGAIFLVREARAKKPLLDLSLFGNKKFTLPLLSGLFNFMAINLVGTLAPFYFQGVMGYTPSQVGLIFMVVPLFMMFSAPLGGALYDKRHWKYQAAAAVLLVGIAFALLSYAFMAGSLWLALAAFAIRGIGGGFFASPNSVETLGALPKEKTAIASSVSSTVTFTGVMLGVAMASILLTADLRLSGYAGPTFLAGASLLSNAVAVISLAAGAFCVMGAAIAALRNI